MRKQPDGFVVEIPVFGQRCYVSRQFQKHFFRYFGIGNGFEIFGAGKPDGFVFFFQKRLNAQLRTFVGLVVCFFQHLVEIGYADFVFLPGERSFVDQSFGVNFTRIFMLGNDVVEFGLRESGFVAFVVPVFAVRKQIDKHIYIELLTEFQRQFRHENHGFHIVAVYVKNGRLRYFGHIGTIGAGASLQVVGGKPNLIVDDNVYGSAGFISV